ncbi:unnamed protein product [Cercospora beticola]|nr:unnamed protein product [Cercospora beticola]
MSASGAEAWQGASKFPEDNPLHERVTDFVKSVDWDALRRHAQSVRGVACELSQSYSTGLDNVVRKIDFADGVQWVARLRMPDMGEAIRRELLSARRTMEVEIVTMAYLRKHTSIPVPGVHTYCLDANTKVGAPYMFMDYIHGTVAQDLAEVKDYDLQTNTAFWKRMAEIQIELASCTFDRIGSLYNIDDNFTIGPELITGKGPWNTAEQYWSDLVKSYHTTAEQQGSLQLKNSPSFQLPSKFLKLIKSYGKLDQKKFCLVNRDFRTHNVLVNDNFEIVGVIDFKSVMAAPIEMVAQFPSFSGLDRPMPFYQEIKKGARTLDWIKATQPYLDKYVDNLRKAAEASSNKEDMLEIVQWMMEDGASILEGLQKYRQHWLFVNEAWWKAYEKLAEKKEMEAEDKKNQ